MSMGTVTVGSTVTEIVPANGARKFVALASLSTNTQTVFLKFDASATVLSAASGYPLAPGEKIALPLYRSVAGDQEAARQITGITSSSTADIRFSEL